MASPLAASSLSVSATVFSAFLGSIGFESLPPLPIISKAFGFLKSLNLSSVGLGLNEVPPEFGWDLALFKVDGEQTVSDGVFESDEAQTGLEVVLELSGVLSGAEDSPDPMSKGVSGLGETEIGPEPIPDLSEARTEPPLVFEDKWDDSFDRVADIEADEEYDILVVIVQPKSVKTPQTGEG